MSFQKYTSPTERRITRKLIEAIFAEPGRCVQVDNGAEERTGLILNASGVYEHLAATGSDHIIIFEGGERVGVVWLVWGNGEDLITDYSDNEFTRSIVEPLLDY